MEDKYAECSVCYDDLYTARLSILVNSASKRVCIHFFHETCGVYLNQMREKLCPVCRRPFHRVVKLPKYDERPNEWFRMIDVNGDGKLDKKEVLEVLKSTLKVEWRSMEAMVDNMWSKWDIDGSGFVDKNELMHPTNGLIAYIKQHAPVRQRPQEPPSISKHPDQWFEYWDEDSSGTLEEAEVIRAMAKTFKWSQQPDKVSELKMIIGALWGDFDSDNNAGRIDKKEFSQGGGLGDTILSNLDL